MREQTMTIISVGAKWVQCPTCQGARYLPDATLPGYRQPCPTCRAAGTVPECVAIHHLSTAGAA